MPVSDSDIVYYRSSVGDSEGGARSVTEIIDGAANALFANIEEADRLAGGTMYRKFFATNEHPTDTMVEPTAFLPVVPVGISEHIGVGFDAADDDEAVLSGNMTAWSANAVLAAASDGADTRELTIIGRTTAGVATQQSLTLTGASEALSAISFSEVYAVMVDAPSATRIISIRQGSGGTLRGTIGLNRSTCFLWMNPSTKGAGMVLPDLIAGASQGFWDRMVWSAGISAARPASSVFALEEA